MPIQMNGQSVGAVFYGSTPISEVYSGGTLVWQNLPRVKLTGQSGTTSQAEFRSAVPDWASVVELPVRLDTSGAGSLRSVFEGCAALAALKPLDTARVTELWATFKACKKLTAIPEMDTRAVVNASTMINGCASLTEVDLSLPACTGVQYMAGNCTSLRSLILRDCGKISNVTSWLGNEKEPDLRALTRVELHGLGPALPAGHVLDLTKTGLDVAGAEALFDSLGTSTQTNRPVIALPESAWAVDQRPAIRKGWRVRTYPEVTFSTVEQFGNAVRINGWPQWYNSASGWALFWAGDTRQSLPYTLNAQGMTDAVGMFNANKTSESNTHLKTVPWFDTRNVTNMQIMFSGCAALTTVPEFDTRNVTNMRGMFQGCAELTEVPELDLTSCTNVGYMLGSAATNPVLPTVTLHNMQRVEDCSWMFGDESDNPAPKLKSARLNGLGPGLTNNMKLDMRRTGLTKDGANTLMDSLGTVTSGRTVTLQLPSGANGCDTSKATSKRWKVTIG